MGQVKFFLQKLVFVIGILYSFYVLVKILEKKFLYKPIACKQYGMIQHKPLVLVLDKHVFLETDKKNKILIVFCHGNSGNLDMYAHFINRLVKEEFVDVLCPEYPEFGMEQQVGEERVLNRRNCVQNVLDAYENVLQRKEYEKVYFFGFSLGTSIATQCVRQLEFLDRTNTDDKGQANDKIKGLVLINGFCSYKMLMEEMLGSFFANMLPLSYGDFDTRRYAEELAILKSSDFKVCLVHTMKDSLIPWKHSKMLFDAFEGLHRKHILIRHGDHNLGPVQYFEEWYPSTALFLF